MLKMQTNLADYSVSMSEFKKNPAQVLRHAGSRPVAVLNHNRPAFYMVAPELFVAMDLKCTHRDHLPNLNPVKANGLCSAEGSIGV